jgi:hypothetical protein
VERGFPWYHDEEIHEKKWTLHEDLKRFIRENEHKLEDEFCEYAFIDEYM